MSKVKAFLQKLNNMSPAAKASFWFVVSNVVLKGISFITTPIFTRLLDTTDYGVSSVFMTWESVISVFATLSLAGGVYNVAMTKYEDDVNTVTSSFIGLTATASILVYSICMGINMIFPSLFELNNWYLGFMWLQTFANAITSLWLMRKRFTYDYKKVIAFTFSNAVLSPIVAIIGVKLFEQNKAIAKVIGSGLWGIMFGLVLMVILISRGKKLYHKGYWKYALKFNIPLIPHYLSGQILSSADKLMLNGIVNAASAGLYSIAYSASHVINILTQAINNSLIPYTLQSIKSGEYKKLKKIIMGCSIGLAVVCAMVTLFSREVILILAPPEYLGAVKYIAPLTFSILITFVSGIVGNILFYYEKTIYMTIATLSTAVLNVFINYVGLVHIKAEVTVAYSTLICTIVRFFIYYFSVNKYEKHLKDIASLKALLLLFGAYALIMVFGMIFWDNLIVKLATLLIVMVLVIVFRKKIIEIIKNIKNKGEPQNG